jgi:hypothetical protein
MRLAGHDGGDDEDEGDGSWAAAVPARPGMPATWSKRSTWYARRAPSTASSAMSDQSARRQKVAPVEAEGACDVGQPVHAELGKG